jgi:hypothetical protein
MATSLNWRGGAGGVRLRFELATVEDTLPPPNMGYTFVDGQWAASRTAPRRPRMVRREPVLKGMRL